MTKNLKISHIKNLTRAKVRNSLNSYLIDILVKFWIIESVYDKKIFKEDIKIIELYYEKFSKWIVLHNASVLAFWALLITTWDRSVLLKFFIWFMLLVSTISALNANIKVNILFNTLVKKQREIKK